MEKSSQIAWKIVPLRHVFPLKVVPLIEVLLYTIGTKVSNMIDLSIISARFVFTTKSDTLIPNMSQSSVGA
jgi:hypothetical protein